MLREKEQKKVFIDEPELKLCREKLEEIRIAPFCNDKASGIGYNFSPSDLIYSLKKRKLVAIRHNEEGSYVWIRPKETLLTLSYEYLQLDSNVAGTIHSKVRYASQGLGNVSTTIDPGWRGMLLLAINNPTNRRIRIQITQNRNGVSERCTLVTAVFMRTTKDASNRESFSFQLDNPPMRIDIWEKLIERPYRNWNNAKYHRFRRFVQTLKEFESKENDRRTLLDSLQKQLLQLSSSMCIKKDKQETDIALLKLERMIPDTEEVVRKRVQELRKVYEEEEKIRGLKNADFDKLNESIDLVVQECKYQVLCDDVEQIHDHIRVNIEKWWEGGAIVRVWHRRMLPHVPSVIASVVIGLLFAFGDDIFVVQSFVGQMIISVLPFILSILINCKKNGTDF